MDGEEVNALLSLTSSLLVLAKEKKLKYLIGQLFN